MIYKHYSRLDMSVGTILHAKDRAPYWVEHPYMHKTKKLHEFKPSHIKGHDESLFAFKDDYSASRSGFNMRRYCYEVEPYNCGVTEHDMLYHDFYTNDMLMECQGLSLINQEFALRYWNGEHRFTDKKPLIECLMSSFIILSKQDKKDCVRR